MKARALLAILLVIAFSVHASDTADEQHLIDYGKTINVKQLDPSLSSQHLDAWLHSEQLHFESLQWEVSPDCDLKPEGTSTYDQPLCVRFVFKKGEVGGWGMIQVGLRRKGITGSPHLMYILLLPSNAQAAEHAAAAARKVSKLSEFPRELQAFTLAMSQH